MSHAIFLTQFPELTRTRSMAKLPALEAFLLLGHRVWPAIFLGAFIVNITTAGSVATSIGIAARFLLADY
jgi:hypothetical protein